MKLSRVCFAVVAAVFIVFGNTPAFAKMHFLDADFAKKACDGWNHSAMPDLLKRGASHYLDSRGGKGKQDMIMHRKECTNEKRMVLRIEADAEGRATCVEGGWYLGKTPEGTGLWSVNPATYKWVKWADGFGFFDLPGILPGFEGDYGLALAHLGEFEFFFAMAHRIAETNGADWACEEGETSADAMKETQEALAHVDKKDRNKILMKGKFTAGGDLSMQ